MKKIVIVFALIFGFATIQAQEKNQKDIYIQNGDVVEATLYFDNGEISQTGFYNKEGQPTGQWLSYNREGDKTAKAQYENGTKVGTWFFWSEDKLTEVDYRDSRIASINTWKNQENTMVSNK